MRGPDVILREGFNEDGEMLKKKKRKDRNTQNVVGEKDVVGTMKWVVCGMGTGESYRMMKLAAELTARSKSPPPLDRGVLERVSYRLAYAGTQPSARGIADTTA